MTASLLDRLKPELSQRLSAKPVAARALGGGDVHAAYRVDLADGRTVFVKTGADDPASFATEASGLTWMAAAGAVAVPDVVACSVDAPGFLVLDWIEPARHRAGASTGADGEATFGRQLAGLHRAGAPGFGRADGATTSSRRLPNRLVDSWPRFYAEQRLIPLRRLADEAEALDRSTLQQLDAVIDRIDDLVGPAEPPARLHGDLWAGNRLVGVDGRSWLIDPACFGGHREFDLAMMRLFGGFGPGCFDAYHESFPLADGWHRRIPLYQLSPLVVHAIKFGGPYRRATAEALAALG